MRTYPNRDRERTIAAAQLDQIHGKLLETFSSGYRPPAAAIELFRPRKVAPTVVKLEPVSLVSR
jgi:hypothetical protein